MCQMLHITMLEFSVVIAMEVLLVFLVIACTYLLVELHKVNKENAELRKYLDGLDDAENTETSGWVDVYEEDEKSES